MASWPKTIPPDLRNRVEVVLGYRTRPTGQDVWGVVQEWLEAHKVEPPPDLAERLPTKE